MHEVAAEYFREQLAAPAGARARQQLAERDVSAKTVEQLGLGYAPGSRDGLKTRLLKQGFAESLLIQSGLVVARDNGEIVDRFRNRLMVPICRDAGSVIAFGGRSMDAAQVPKYLNSPETAIYSKGRTLYGLNLTKAGIRKRQFVVLVEGYFDFAQVFQSEAAPVVAPLARPDAATGAIAPAIYVKGRAQLRRMPPDRAPRRVPAKCWSKKDSKSTSSC